MTKPAQEHGQTCENCTYFIDYRSPDDEPGETNGYCCHDFANGILANEYGGHWTRADLWCVAWKDGPPIFKTFGEAQPVSSTPRESDPSES